MFLKIFYLLHFYSVLFQFVIQQFYLVLFGVNTKFKQQISGPVKIKNFPHFHQCWNKSVILDANKWTNNNEKDE